MNKNITSLIIVIAIIFVSLVILNTCKPKTKIEVIEPNTTTDITIRNKPAKIMSIKHYDSETESYVNNEIATLDTILTSNDKKVKVDLNLKYDEYANTFDLDSVITQYPTKPKTLRFISAIGIGTDITEPDITKPNIDVSAGIKIVDKYSISAYVNNEKQAGLRFGVDF